MYARTFVSIRGLVIASIHHKSSGDVAIEAESSVTELKVKDVCNLGTCRGEEAVNGMKTLGCGSHGQPGRRSSLCRVENMPRGARIANVKVWRLVSVSEETI